MALILELIFRLPAVQQKTGGNWPKLKKWMDYVWYNERNSLGFRDREHGYEKAPGTYRILILGDSVTYGQMVNYPEIYPVVLEKKLNDQGKNVEIIKMALMGWNTMEELDALVNYGQRFKPDMVIIAFYLNDPQTKQNPQGKEIADAERTLIPFAGIDQRLNEKSYFYSFVRWRYNRFLEKIGRKDDYNVWQKSLYNQSSRGWQDFEFALKQVNIVSRENGAKVLFVNFGFEQGWDTEVNQVLALAKSIDLPVLDMRSYFGKYEFKDLIVSPSDAHPNSFTHNQYAQILADYLLVKM